MSNKSLIQEISEVEFLCTDLNLYLDTHPKDTAARADYNFFCGQLRALKDRFIMECGPIENFGNSVNKDRWQWNESPWPWE
jgi:spore coat protein JB